MTHAVLTGPIRGTVTLEDGTVVDVRPEIVYVETHEQAKEVAHLIGERYAAEGHPLLEPDAKFTHDKKQTAKNLREVTDGDGD
jgi:hypothetical protein